MANVGYVEVLRRNRSFRWLWLAEVVSLAGDWFTTIALFSLLLELTGRGEAVGLALVVRFLPQIFFGPLAGVIADRVPRRAIMILCDVGRAGVVLGFLAVHGRGDVWLVYALTFAQLTFSTFFETAEMAAIGSVVSREEIVAANTLQGLTWSAMLSLGALLGGWVTDVVGRTLAFWIDSASFLLSAFFVSRAVVPLVAPAAEQTASWAKEGWGAFVDGLRVIRRSPLVAHAISAKAFWGLFCGGAIMLYSVIGQRVFPMGSGASWSIGLLYACRGIGALAGPLMARWSGEDTERALELRITLAFWVAAVGYAVCGLAPTIAWAAFGLVIAHMGVATQWVFSTALINLRVPDEMRGRVFAADMSINTAGMIISILIVGRLLDGYGIGAQTLMACIGAGTLIPGILWPLIGRALVRQRTVPGEPGA